MTRCWWLTMNSLVGGRNIGGQVDPNFHFGDDLSQYRPTVQRLSNVFDETLYTYA